MLLSIFKLPTFRFYYPSRFQLLLVRMTVPTSFLISSAASASALGGDSKRLKQISVYFLCGQRYADNYRSYFISFAPHKRTTTHMSSLCACAPSGIWPENGPQSTRNRRSTQDAPTPTTPEKRPKLGAILGSGSPSACSSSTEIVVSWRLDLHALLLMFRHP